MGEATPAEPHVTVHLLREVRWRYNRTYLERVAATPDGPVPDKRVGVFPDRAACELARWQREEARRAEERCPFRFGDSFNPASFTSLPFETFAGRLRRAGLHPPQPYRSGYTPYSLWHWWALQKRITPEQIRAVWDACNKVRFYETEPIRLPLDAGRDEPPAGASAAAPGRGRPLFVVFARVYREERFGHRYRFAD